MSITLNADLEISCSELLQKTVRHKMPFIARSFVEW